MPRTNWDQLSSEEFAIWRKWFNAEQDNLNQSARDHWNENFLPNTVELDADDRAVMQAAFEAGYVIGMGDAVRGLILNRRDDTPLPNWVSEL